MASNVPASIADALRDHIHLFTEADLDFLHMEIYRDWLSETRSQTLFEFSRFIFLLGYWGFISKISPKEKDSLIALYRKANDITDEELQRR